MAMLGQFFALQGTLKISKLGLEQVWIKDDVSHVTASILKGFQLSARNW